MTININIPRVRLQLEIVTPLLLGGADARGVPELRSAPFRGQLRYWLRAYLANENVEDLKKIESQLMGSTNFGSALNLRVFTNETLRYGKRELLLHKPSGSRLSVNGIVEKQRFLLELSGFPMEADIDQRIKYALLLWLNLGGVGKRCRRGMGSLQNGKSNFENGDHIAESLNKILNFTSGNLQRLDYSPGVGFPKIFSTVYEYPAFQPDSWLIVVCREPFPSYSDALRDFWKFHLRSTSFASRYAYGWVRKKNDQPDVGGDMRPDTNNGIRINRRSSPFHLHVARSAQGYHLILTAFHASPAASTGSRDKIISLTQNIWIKHNGTLFYSL